MRIEIGRWGKGMMKVNMSLWRVTKKEISPQTPKPPCIWLDIIMLWVDLPMCIGLIEKLEIMMIFDYVEFGYNDGRIDYVDN